MSFSRYANGMDRGVLTQKGLASPMTDMWNFSPSMVLIWPSKAVGNSLINSSDVVGVRFVVVMALTSAMLLGCG